MQSVVLSSKAESMSGRLVVRSLCEIASARAHTHMHARTHVRTHTCMHTRTHCICLMNEHQLLKKSFISWCHVLTSLQLHWGPRSNWLYSSPLRPTLFCLFSQLTANQTSLFSSDTSICLTPKQQMAHIWHCSSSPIQLIMRLLWVGGHRGATTAEQTRA